MGQRPTDKIGASTDREAGDWVIRLCRGVRETLAADLLLEPVRFEPILAGRPVGMLSVEPASAGARQELHSLAPVLAAAVGRVASLRETDQQKRKAEFLLSLTEAAATADSIDELLASA